MSKKHSFAERKERSVVTPFEVKGSVTSRTETPSKVVLIWNISDTGLCIWTDSRYKKGEMVNFCIEHPWQVTFECEVRWARTVPDRSGYILGLYATTNQEKLVDIHKELIRNLPKVG